MSDANRITIFYKKETIFGTSPAGNWQTQRLAGETLGLVTDTMVSDELEASRMVLDVVRKGRHAEGNLIGRMSYLSLDDWIMSSLMANQADTWQAVVTFGPTATTITAATGANTLTRSTGSFVTDGFAVGRLVRVKFMVANSAEFYGRIITLTATVMTLDHVALVNEAAIANVEIEQGGYVNNGTTERSWAIERQYGDVASTFAVYNGMEVESMNLRVGADTLMEATFGFIGKSQTNNVGTSAGAPIAAPTGRLINGIDHVKAVMIDGTTVPMSDFSIATKNNIRQQMFLGTLGPGALGFGQFEASVDLSAYFSGNTQISKYLAFTDSGLAVRVVDAAGNAYMFHWPAGNWIKGTANAEKTNDDVRAQLTFMSKKDAVTSMQMQVARWAA